MIEMINRAGEAWLPFFGTYQLQNTLFILLVLALLRIFRNTKAVFKKQLTLVALLKTLIPPVVTVPFMAQTVNSDVLPFLFLSVPIDAAADGVAPGNALHYAGILFLLWLLGALLIVLISFYSFFRLRFILSRAQMVTPQKSYIPPYVRMYKAEKIRSPLVFGCISPKILLPEQWDCFDNRMQRSVLTHEYCHIKNGDLWFNGLKMLSLMLHFINPLHWILLHYFEVFSEMACDDRAIEESGLKRDEYNSLILQSAEALTLSGWMSGARALSRAFKLLKKRITYQLIQKEKNMKKHSPFVRLSVVVILFAAIIPFSWQCSNTAEKEKEAPSPVASVAGEQPEITDASGVYDYFAVDKKPKLVQKAQPEYPELARRAGIEGIVPVTVTVDESGRVIKAEVLTEMPVKDDQGNITEVRQSKRIPVLEPAALAAAEKCRFEPATLNGKPVKVKMVVPFRFRLQ